MKFIRILETQWNVCERQMDVAAIFEMTESELKDLLLFLEIDEELREYPGD